MSKLKSFFKRHKGFSTFLIIVLILGIARFGAYLYKVQNPNEIYYGADDLFNFELYENFRDADNGNWELTQEPTKLGKIYKSPHSLIPSATLYGFENDPEHIFIRDDCPVLPLLTLMKKKDYGVFDVNCIEKILIEHIDVSTQKKLVGYVELTKQEDFSFWISLIQELRSGNHEKSDHSGFRTNEYRVYFYIKGIANARYWVANINLEERTITVGLTSMDPPYVLSEQLAEMIIKEEKAVK